MDKSRAWDIVNKVCSDFRGTRADHIQIQMALDALKPEVAPKPADDGK